MVRGRHLENSGEVAHVEEVVELGRGREHLGLHRAPQADGHLGQVPNHLRRRGSATCQEGKSVPSRQTTGDQTEQV